MIRPDIGYCQVFDGLLSLPLRDWTTLLAPCCLLPMMPNVHSGSSAPCWRTFTKRITLISTSLEPMLIKYAFCRVLMAVACVWVFGECSESRSDSAHYRVWIQPACVHSALVYLQLRQHRSHGDCHENLGYYDVGRRQSSNSHCTGYDCFGREGVAAGW